ncbi:MAG TPA: GAF domain-containing protein [Ktedonobacteraceae bacterium]|jgi:transcriptional regulator with XRE-family HTH domain|nr:GAF domain-containing protein [Ktedonobacteraceae bacterium]
MQQGPGDWRELLGTIISNPQERQRIAQEMRVQPITLARWIKGEAEPRPHNLRQLLHILQPVHRDLLLKSLGDKLGEWYDETVDDAASEIPSEFYRRIFSAHAGTKPTLRYWSITSLILQQALSQLDPERRGLAITIIRCMRSSNSQKIRSLRESVGKGTAPWSGELEQKGMFLGAESLAGYVVTTCQPAQIQNTFEDKSLPAHQVEYELSAAAHPILYTGRIAGCVLISSTQPNYFISPARNALIGEYANLLALAIEPEEFVDPLDIELMLMPPHEKQKQYFATFRQRVTQVLLTTSMSNQQAEQYVWEQLEEELLQAQLESVVTG